MNTWYLGRAAHRPAVVLCCLVATSPALAKEEHFQQLRVLLMTEKATCLSCHVAADVKDLNPYGRALAAQGRDQPLSERMLALDRDPGENDTPTEKAKQRRLQDIDGDGVPNWVEVLAGTNPGDKNSVPSKAVRERIEAIVSCEVCHTANNLPGTSALESNPHNELGKLLARTPDPKDRVKPGTDAQTLRGKAARTPILRRFKLTAMKPTGGAKPSAWEKLLLLHKPADSRDNPDKQELLDLRKLMRAQKSPKTRDPTRGMGPHKPDGFLLDAR